MQNKPMMSTLFKFFWDAAIEFAFTRIRIFAGRHASPVANTAALLFDCDGVLADTERDWHRVSFNKVFAERGLGF